MKISLFELIEGHKNVIDINIKIQLSDRILPDHEMIITSPVEFIGRITGHNGEIFLSGSFSCDMEFICHRCLVGFKRKINESVNERLVVSEDSTSEDPEEFYQITNYMIDIREILENEFIVSLPIKVICNESCKGLCPVCGVNLNSNECQCDEDKIDPRLLKLKELLQND